MERSTVYVCPVCGSELEVFVEIRWASCWKWPAAPDGTRVEHKPAVMVRKG